MIRDFHPTVFARGLKQDAARYVVLVEAVGFAKAQFEARFFYQRDVDEIDQQGE